MYTMEIDQISSGSEYLRLMENTWNKAFAFIPVNLHTTIVRLDDYTLEPVERGESSFTRGIQISRLYKGEPIIIVTIGDYLVNESNGDFGVIKANSPSGGVEYVKILKHR